MNIKWTKTLQAEARGQTVKNSLSPRTHLTKGMISTENEIITQSKLQRDYIGNIFHLQKRTITQLSNLTCTTER